MEKLIIVFALLAVVLLNAVTGTFAVPIQDGGYPGEDVDDVYRMMSDLPMKRGMCRPGYTYQPITRICVPSLGELRRHRSNMINRLQALRGRGRGQGRRY